MAAITTYVDTDVVGPGTGTAIDPYDSLATWYTNEVGVGLDLIAAGNNHTVICTGTAADVLTATLNLTNVTANATNFLKFICNDPLSEIYQTNRYRIEAVNRTLVTGAPNGFVIENIPLNITGGVSNVYCILISSPISDFVINNCRLENNSAQGDAIFFGGASDGSTATLNSCIIEGSPGCGIGDSFSNGTTVTINNTVITGCTDGISSQQANFNLKNCALFNNSSNDILEKSTGVISATYTASDDPITGIGNIDISPGAIEADDWGKTFVDYLNGNFTIRNTLSSLYLAGNPIVGLTTDYLGNTYDATTPSIGAFEYTGADYTIYGDLSITITVQGYQPITGVPFILNISLKDIAFTEATLRDITFMEIQ